MTIRSKAAKAIEIIAGKIKSSSTFLDKYQEEVFVCLRPMLERYL